MKSRKVKRMHRWQLNIKHTVNGSPLQVVVCLSVEWPYTGINAGHGDKRQRSCIVHGVPVNLAVLVSVVIAKAHHNIAGLLHTIDMMDSDDENTDRTCDKLRVVSTGLVKKIGIHVALLPWLLMPNITPIIKKINSTLTKRAHHLWMHGLHPSMHLSWAKF